MDSGGERPSDIVQALRFARMVIGFVVLPGYAYMTWPQSTWPWRVLVLAVVVLGVSDGVLHVLNRERVLVVLSEWLDRTSKRRGAARGVTPAEEPSADPPSGYRSE